MTKSGWHDAAPEASNTSNPSWGTLERRAWTLAVTRTSPRDIHRATAPCDSDVKASGDGQGSVESLASPFVA
jgi:phosphatidylserine decarboxylase